MNVFLPTIANGHDYDCSQLSCAAPVQMSSIIDSSFKMSNFNWSMVKGCMGICDSTYQKVPVED